MGTDVQTTLRTAARAILADTGAVFTNAIMDEAIAEAVADISRMIPRELVYIDVLHARTVTAETFTSSTGNWVTLDNKPIDPRTSPTVTNNAVTVTYVEDTDYIMDYATGRVQTLAAGSIGNGVANTKITYEKSLQGIDISSLTDLIQVERVEISRGGPAAYQEWANYWQWGDILWLSSVDGTQERFSENDHVRVWYRAEHTKPGGSAGTYPAYVDDMVVQGAVAHALFGKHRAENHLAVIAAANAGTAAAAVENNAAAAVTALVLANSANADIENNAAAAVTALGAADTANALIEDNAAAGITALGASNTELAKVIGKLELAEGGVGEPITLALAALAKVTTHITTEADNVMDNVATRAILNEIDTTLDNAINSIILGKLELDDVTLEVIDNSSGTSGKSADDYLNAGDDLIAGLNTAAGVPENYADYARVKIQGAHAIINSALARYQHGSQEISVALAKIRGYEAMQGEASVQVTMAIAYVREAEVQLGLANFYVAEAGAITRSASAYVDEARGYFETSQVYALQSQRYTEEAQTYINVSNTYALQGQRFTEEAQGYVNVSNAYALQAQAFHGTVDRHNQIADRFLSDARERYRIFWGHLSSRVERGQSRNRVSSRQHAT